MKVLKIKEVYPISEMLLAVVFENKNIKVYDVNVIANKMPIYNELKDKNLFKQVYVDCGGHAIAWDDEIDICEYELWKNGREMSEDEYLRFIIGKLVYTRNKNNISQRKLAELSGVSQPVIARIESNAVEPNLRTLIKLTKALNVSIDVE